MSSALHGEVSWKCRKPGFWFKGSQEQETKLLMVEKPSKKFAIPTLSRKHTNIRVKANFLCDFPTTTTTTVNSDQVNEMWDDRFEACDEHMLLGSK